MRITRALPATALALTAVLLAGTATAAPTRTLATGLVVTGEQPNDQAGLQVRTADLDGDGHDDLVVGAWLNDRGGQDSGAVYIEYGPLSRGFSLGRADVVLHPDRAGQYVGEGPLGVLDMDGDGAQDLVLGAPGAFLATQPGSPGQIGEAFVLYGGRRLSGTHRLAQVADATLVGRQLGEWLGFGSAGVGDLDRDGYEELLVGAPATAAYSGVAYLFYGSAKRLTGRVSVGTADSVVVGGRAGMFLGYEATGGDLDGDGTSDLVVGSSSFLAPGPVLAHVWHGTAGRRLPSTLLASSADAVLRGGTTTGTAFTPPVLVMEADLTGDGRVDLLVGDGSVGSISSGRRVSVIAGGVRLRGMLDLATVAVTTATGLGHVPGVGDVTGDRRADLVIGDPTTSEVRVFAGPLRPGALKPAAALTTLTSPAAERAGAAIAVADVAGDRRADLVVGAPREAQGRVYVVPSRR